MIKLDRMMPESSPLSGRGAIAVIWKVCPLLYDLPFISVIFLSFYFLPRSFQNKLRQVLVSKSFGSN